MGKIYCITTPSHKRYIGQTINTVEERVRSHELYPECRAIHGAITKYGIDNCIIETLVECPDKLLDFYEINFIAYLGTLCPGGYNIRTGGSKGKHCEDSRERMRQSKLGEKNHNFGKPRSDQCKHNISLAKSGEKHHFYGQTLSQEHKLALSKAHKKTQPELPMYMVYVKPRPDQYQDEGYAIINHPTLKTKYYTSKKMKLNEKYDVAFKYLQSTSAVQRLDVGG